MRILFISWNFPPTVGGIEYVAGRLFQGLRDRGHDISALVAHGDPSADPAGVRRAPQPGLFAFGRFAFTKGWSLCKRAKPDIIVCGTVVAAAPTVALSRLLRIPYVVLVHGSDVLHEGLFYRIFIRFLLKRAKGICANSRNTKSILLRAGYPDAKISVIYPGVDTKAFEKEPPTGAEALLSEIDGRQIILSVGRLVRRKGILEFVQWVLPELAKRFPKLIYLVVGEDARQSLVHNERMKDLIEAKVRELKLENYVKLLGHVPDNDLRRLYFHSSAFLLPCLDIPGDVEGFGIVFLEAALAGVPIVASRVGGIPEAVEDGETGFLVKSGDYAALITIIGKILRDDSLRKALGRSAAERARRLFAWPGIVEQYESVLQSMVDRKE